MLMEKKSYIGKLRGIGGKGEGGVGVGVRYAQVK